MNGRRVTPMQFGSIAPFSEGLALAYIDGGYGYIDRTGGFVIPPRFQEGWSFANGRARVRIHGSVYQIDHSGRVVAGPAY
jgi:hypothetical protein